jgi:hypothetical protein
MIQIAMIRLMLRRLARHREAQLHCGQSRSSSSDWLDDGFLAA